MEQTESMTMPWGKHKGRPVSSVDTNYLRWLLRECINAAPALRAAVQAELDRRAESRRQSPVAAAPAPALGVNAGSAPGSPSASTVDHAAVLRLLSDLVGAGHHVVARGEGAVHVYALAHSGALTAGLRSRLTQYHAHLDTLARWVRWESPGRPRITPATLLLTRLRSAGVAVVAHQGGDVGVAPGSETDPLAALTPTGRRELWVRLALNLPDADGAFPADTVQPHPGVLAGLHGYCVRRAERADRRAAGDQSRRWLGIAAAVQAVRNGQVGAGAGTKPELVDLASYCRRQAATLARRDRIGASSKWVRWA